MSQYDEFLNKYVANAMRMEMVGIHPFGFDPGYLCMIDGMGGKGVDIPDALAKIICRLVIEVYPETKDDKDMIEAYKRAKCGETGQ
jgi:hypothetical protein